MMGDRGRTVCSLLIKYCGHTVEPAAVLMALQGVQQLVYQIVDIKQLQLCGRIVDMERKAVGHIVAEGSHSAVVIGAAPFSKEIRESVDQYLSSRFLRIPEEQLLPGLLGPAVLTVSEAA